MSLLKNTSVFGVRTMRNSVNAYIVDETALPEVVLKAYRAQKLLETGEAASAKQAAAVCGISRAAFYKYRFSVRPFHPGRENTIITIYALLKDERGMLSNLLAALSKAGANILTINQNIPVNSFAPVTVTLNTADLSCGTDELIVRLSAIPGVKNTQILA